MKLEDFKIGQKYKKIGGEMYVDEIGTCVDINGFTVKIEFPSNPTSYSICCNPENWEPVQWIPKRGEKVLVSSGRVYLERIFLTTIEGSRYPYICVTKDAEQKYLDGQTFTFHQWINIKPIPKDEITLTVNGKPVTLSTETIKAIKEAL